MSFLKNDAWHVLIDLNISAYEVVLSAISGNLILVDKQKKEFTSISDLRLNKTLLNTLENILYNF
jgi:hypothetical protein